MAKVDALLSVLGLTTRQQLDKAVAKKKQWHGLVRDVFAQYYVKFRESSLDNLPELPARYSADWEQHMRREVDEFLKLDLESVGALLEACGFGTEKWNQIKDVGFPAFRKLVDDYLESDEDGIEGGNGHFSLAEIESAVSEDLQHLLSDHPDVMDDLAKRLDPQTGLFLPTDDDVRSSDLYLEVEEEVKKLRKGGLRALDQIRELELQVEELRAQLAGGNGRSEAVAELEEAEEAGGLAARDEDAGDADVAEMDPATAALFDRGAAVEELEERVDELEKQLKTRDHAIAGLQEQLDQVSGGSTDLTELRKRASALEKQLEEEVGALKKDLKSRDFTIEQLQETLGHSESSGTLQETLGHSEPSGTQQESATGGTTESIGDLQEELERLRNDLKSREHKVAQLQEQLEQSESPGSELEEVRKRAAATESELQEELDQLRKDLKARERTLEGLREELEQAQAAVQSARRPDSPESEDDSGEEAAPGLDLAASVELKKENDQLRSDLNASDHTAKTLRHQLEQFEEELGKARDQLVAEVQKLAALTSGEADIKPSEELQSMDADELLGYAKDVAEDLDVRRQTLDEGLQGIDTVKESFEENSRVYEQQQLELQKQLHELRTSLDDRDRELQAAQKAGGGEISAEDARDTIGKQRQQLELLSTRVKQLMSTNNELQDTNKKTYVDLEQAVRRLMPLRKQIEDLEHLSDAISAYIREKHDRSFTTRKLSEVLK